MTDEEKNIFVRTLLDNDSEATSAVVDVYLTLAEDKVLNRLYPLGIPSTVVSVPSKYEISQCELARNLFLRRGAEGESAHSEDGVSRTYGTVDDDEILGKIVPFGKLV